GAMEFEVERLPSKQEMGVLSQVTDRFGLAAESSRLLFETRRIADREVQVNEIGARLQTATDLEGVLGSAAEGLRDTLGAPRVSGWRTASDCTSEMAHEHATELGGATGRHPLPLREPDRPAQGARPADYWRDLRRCRHRATDLQHLAGAGRVRDGHPLPERRD